MNSKLKTVRKGHPRSKPFAYGVDRMHNNIFDYGDWINLALLDYKNNPWNYANDIDITKLYMQSKNAFGLSKMDNPFSKGNIKGGLKAMAGTPIGGALVNGLSSTIGKVGGDLIGGNLLSTVGNAVRNTAGTVGGIVGGFNPIAGAVVSIGGNLLGGLFNRAFGSSMNWENINKINNNISDVFSNSTFDSSSGRALIDSYSGRPILKNFSQSDVGEDGWFSNEASNKFNELKRNSKVANRLQIGNLNLSATNLNNNIITNQLAKVSAFGGPIDVDPSTPIGYSIYTDKYTKDKYKQDNKIMPNMLIGLLDNIFSFGGNTQIKGADFSNGTIHIDAGGTHEDNPNDGVQIGTDQEGIPNLVEEGEVIYNDYVFSNRLIVPRGMRGNYGKRNKYAKGGKLNRDNSDGQLVPYELEALKPFEGLTFADAVKKAEKLSGADERPTDPIAQRGLLAMLQVLAGTQEKEREKEKLQEMKDAIDNMTPEEFAMLQQLMQASQEAQAQQQAMAQLQLMIPQGMEQMMPQELMVAYGGPIYSLGGLLNNWNSNKGNTFASGGSINEDETWYKDLTPLMKWIVNALGINNEEEFDKLPMDFKNALESYYPYTADPDFSGYSDYDLDKIFLNLGFNTNTINNITPELWKQIYNSYMEDVHKFNEAHPNIPYRRRNDNNYRRLWDETYEGYAPRSKVKTLTTGTELPTELATPDLTPTPRNREEVKEEEIKVEGPEAEAFNYYNNKHTDKPLTAKEWNQLDDKEKNKYIKLYKNSLGNKANRENFDARLSAYNKQVDINNKINEYRTKLKKSHLTYDDIKNMNWEQLERIASRVDPNYTYQDRSRMSQNEKESAEAALKESIVQKSKDNNVTVDDINTSFTAPTIHKDWKPIDPETAWQETSTGYDWTNPLYGGEHDVITGNTEGRYQSKDWSIKDGDNKGKIKVGDRLYDNMQKYETSDEYLLPRYELAKSAASEDEDNLKIWKDYVATLDNRYTNKYIPTTVFGEDYANHLGSYEDFKNFIISNYDTLNKAGSGFFDLIGGQMHGMMLPTSTRSRELYQMADNKGVYLNPEGNWQNYYTDVVSDDGKGTKIHTLSPNGVINIARANGLPEDIVLNPDGSYKLKTENEPFPKMRSWPYLVGAGLLATALGYNLLSPADYSNADAMISAAKEAGRYIPVGFKPVGEYLRYNPFDINYVANQLRASELANARTLANASNGNIGALLAGLLANNYNNQIALGNAYRQAFEYNDANRAKTAEFNRGTDEFNSEGFLKADMANQDAYTRARGYLLEGLKNGYAMRQAIDDAKANAINAGLTGLGTTLFNYALNKYNQDMLGWGIRNGAYAPLAERANGGRIRRYNGLTF